MSVLEKITDGVVKGNEPAVVELTQKAIDSGNDLEDIIYKGLVKGMEIVAEKWKTGELFVPEVLVAARAMKAGMNLVSPLLQKEMVSLGTVIMGTVKGDIHDIGKNLVNLMLEASGFRVVDLGTNVDKEVFVQSAKDNNADIIGISSLLTTTMPYMGEVIKACKDAGLDKTVKIMVGGAPVSQEYANTIGADSYAKNASIAVEKAKNLLH